MMSRAAYFHKLKCETCGEEFECLYEGEMFCSYECCELWNARLSEYERELSQEQAERWLR